jgi:hypothetical protein
MLRRALTGRFFWTFFIGEVVGIFLLAGVHAALS